MLEEAQADSARLIAAPSRLLESQPALRRLKDGLVDAQIRTATLQGRMSAEHPEVIAARAAEAEVAARLHNELAAAKRGVETELSIDSDRVKMLESQRTIAAGRMTRLAGLRAAYANLLGEVANRARLLEHAEQSLTRARSDRAAANAASLVTCLGSPDTGAGPVSPGGLTIVLGGLLGGLLTGFGIVLLTAPSAAAPHGSATFALTSYAVPMPQDGASLAALGEPWSLAVTAHDR